MNAAIDLDNRVSADSAPAVDPAVEVSLESKGVKAKKGSVLRYRADRRSVSFVLGMFALHALAFFLAPPWLAAICLVPLAIGSMFIAAINHHHQHFNTFRSPWLNRIYELVLALQTGISPFGWVLHHNLGHHRNYLNQPPHPEPDESNWTRPDGSQMGRVEYTIDLILNHQLDIFRVGWKYPKFLRAFLLMKIPLYVIIAVALYINPVNAFLVLLIPSFIALCHTSWATYEHHAGHYPTDHYDASMNRKNAIFNFLTCNLGLHTAHHLRPGVHWSLLPKLHEEIENRIPPEMILTTFW
ncbi:MAG: fatty acid desaturase [bacterium]|nr:fatty acid desaturase [Deltaproteobacteria bacterium]MCP4904663.1 fatty acid desaturase [bacterium]